MARSAGKTVVMLEEETVIVTETETEQEANTRPEELRLLEALLFAAGEPVDEKSLAKRMPEDTDVKAALR